MYTILLIGPALMLLSPVAECEQPLVRGVFKVSVTESSAIAGSYWTGYEPIPVACHLLVNIEDETVRVVPLRLSSDSPDGLDLCELLPTLTGTVVGVTDDDGDGVFDELELEGLPPACLVLNQSDWTGRLERGSPGQKPLRLIIDGWTGMPCTADGFEFTYELFSHPTTLVRPARAEAVE